MFNKQHILGLITLLVLLSSCGPINYFTRIKKTPREYSLNYCGEDIKAPKTEFNKELWVVFSDRENNVTYRNPGGKVKMKELNFLDAFFVIKEKGEYLCLIKYDPAIVENNMFNGKIKDRKKAQYCGWIHRSHLLLTKQSVTDIATGFKTKQVSIITDTVSLIEPELFFVKDSIRVFKDLNLTIDNGKVPLYEVLYTLKTFKKKNLIARKTIVSPDSATTDILGWVHSSLVKDMGQRLHVNIQSLPEDSLWFKTNNNSDTLPVSRWAMDESLNISKRKDALRYSHVSSYCKIDSLITFNTGIPTQVVDQSDNYVFNVNGNKITYTKFKELEKDLRKLNIVFVFEGKEQVIENYPAAINVIQNLQPLFEAENDTFSYRFGAIMASQGKSPESLPLIKSTGLTKNYTEVLDYLITQTDTTNKYLPLPTQHTWSGVRKAVDMVEPYSNETNIFVIIGEAGYSEWADSVLVKRMAKANCRILGFQIHGIKENAGNNFVLQIENMIENCSKRESLAKREKIVFVDQLRPTNKYRESSKNVYALDFPTKSMTQGWILFPEKSTNLPLDILTNCVDTLISEVKWDNDNLISSLYKAFNTVGNHRYQYDSLLVKYNYLNFTQTLKKEVTKTFSKELPAWYLPAQKVAVPDTFDKEIKYHLLLSKEEMDDLTLFINALCANEVDYKYKGKKQKTRKKCNCPDDDEILEVPEMQIDSLGNPAYLSTRKIRRSLQKIYLDELKSCKLCKIKTKTLKKLTLAEAQRRITGCPTYSPVLEKYVVNDIKRKKCLPDAELDKLISYFKLKKEALDKYINNPDKFESNGQTYFWIDQKLLP